MEGQERGRQGRWCEVRRWDGTRGKGSQWDGRGGQEKGFRGRRMQWIRQLQAPPIDKSLPDSIAGCSALSDGVAAT